jgi:type I restriction enzyme R subunit
MKQAIDEGFIMDVLKNYLSYETYFALYKKVE